MIGDILIGVFTLGVAYGVWGMNFDVVPGGVGADAIGYFFITCFFGILDIVAILLKIIL